MPEEMHLKCATAFVRNQRRDLCLHTEGISAVYVSARALHRLELDLARSPNGRSHRNVIAISVQNRQQDPYLKKC